MAKFSKAIAAAIAALVVIAGAVSDKEVTKEEWVAISGAVAGVVAVYQVRNRPDDDAE